MREIRSTPLALMVIAWLTALGIPTGAAPRVIEAEPQTARAPAVSEEFQAMMAKVDAAQLELQNGKPAAFKGLWSHADDVTLSGGFGGAIEKGWEQVSRRLDWVGADSQTMKQAPQ